MPEKDDTTPVRMVQLCSGSNLWWNVPYFKAMHCCDFLGNRQHFWFINYCIIPQNMVLWGMPDFVCVFGEFLKKQRLEGDLSVTPWIKFT